MLDTLSDTSFLRIPLPPRKAPPSASTTSSLGGALIRSLRLYLTQILPFLISMIPFSNRGRCRRSGTITWQHIFIHDGSVFFMSQSRSGLTATISLGGCLYPPSLTLLGTNIPQFCVLNIRLFIMLVLICLLSRYHRIAYYYINPLDHCSTDQPRTKQISFSASQISKHVIHTHNIDKVTFNCEIYLTAKLTY